MRNLSYAPVYEKGCLFYKNSTYILFYVDDFVITGPRSTLDGPKGPLAQLYALLDMRYLGPLQWFLSIRIVKNRVARTLALSHKNYIDRLVITFLIGEYNGNNHHVLIRLCRDLSEYEKQADKVAVFLM